MKVLVPPIKSQGIKTKLVPWIFELAPKVNGRWIEPFLGTGVVAFNSGFEKAILNDVNPHLINFYKAIQAGEINSTSVKAFLEEEGERLLKAEENGAFHYKTIRNRFNDSFDPLDFLFLSRAGFNGMIRFSKKGKWNIPFCKKPNRFAQSYVTKIVNQIINCQKVIKKSWEFYNIDFEEIIKMGTQSDLIYCDPPYYGRYVDYYNGWTEADELRLFDALSKTKSKFIMSTWHHNDYRKNEMIDRLWSKFNIITKDHFYHTGAKEENRNPVVEALVFNFDAKIDLHKTRSEKTKEVEQLALI